MLIPETSLRQTCTWFTIPVTASLVLTSTTLYLVFRIYTTASVQQEHIFNAGLAWLFLALESIMLCANFCMYATRALAITEQKAPQFYLHGNNVPEVDILITCCREDNHIILNTVRAACALDWPKDRLRIFLLDDGRSKLLSESIAELRPFHPNLFYASRSKPEIPDYKAGNLNNGLAVTAALPDGPSPFVAGLDADMIPRPQWLRTLMPHLVDDPNMGMVCPPQHFYNTPWNDPLDQDLNLFYRQKQPCHQAVGAADCWGSGYIARRTALDTVGGFPTWTLAEDSACSMLLLGSGWKTAFIDEQVQIGQVPDTYAAHVKQRTRWVSGLGTLSFIVHLVNYAYYVQNLGYVQNAGKLRAHLARNPPVGTMSCLSISQRIAGMSHEFSALAQWGLWLSILGLPLALLSGYPFVIYASNWQLQWLIRLAAAHQIAMGLHCCACLNFAPYKIAFRADQNESWMIPYHMLTMYRHYIIPSAFGGRRTGFQATGSFNSTLNERDKTLRAPFLRRLRVMLFENLVILHVLFLLACVSGFILAFLRAFLPHHDIGSAYPLLVWLRNSPLVGVENSVTTKVRLVYLLTRIGWPPLLWYSTCVGMFTPIWYTLFPPTTAAEDEMLVMDAKTKVMYPTAAAMMPAMSSWGRLRDHTTVLVTTYSIFAFVISWYV